MEAPEAKLLVGVDTGGRIQRSTDGGATWRADGALPAPAAAFTAVTADRLLATTEDGTVYDSNDGGTTFTIAYNPAKAP